MRQWLPLIAMLLALVACGNPLKRLSDMERSHYEALKVFLDQDTRKSWLKLKTEEERTAWLKSNGPNERQTYWDIYYQYDEDMQQAIAAGDVQIGWKQDAVLMAWGAPYRKLRLAGRDAARSEAYTYRFEVDADGYLTVWTPDSKTANYAEKLIQIDVILDDGQVAEMNQKDDWD